MAEFIENSYRKELDFLSEANNIERVRENFKNDENVYVPKVNYKYTSKEILTMEFIHGLKINDINGISSKFGFSKKEILNLLFEKMALQVFEYGFVHCDPVIIKIFLKFIFLASWKYFY
jgi:ubiquinone biosynthesis protein